MSKAPTGNVTLVFTDIQGSTLLWEHLGDDFKPLLDLHNSIFRAAIAETGGYEVKTEGDSFMVAFSDAAAAISMCLKIQERLHEAPWPDWLSDDVTVELAGTSADGAFRGLRVRMGVHTGSPDCQVDTLTSRMDYFGRMVNRASRVASVGHGGQLLVSDATWTALQSGDLPSTVVVTDLGEHAIRDLEQRERLRQLLPAALASRRFPRIKTLSLKKTNLPNQVDSFFGRDEELGEIKQRIAKGQRLITVLGAGGTGKTRLAQHLGGSQLDTFPGGVWFCDLSEARSKAAIMSTMGVTIEVPLTQRDPEAQLANAIEGRGRTLLILDNFEQIVDHATDTVGQWLQRAPDAVFLVTSRALLRIRGEDVLYLDPLPAAEAVNLFCDRAQAVSPAFDRTPEQELVITEIVERLDCMSLAVELAAARVRMLSPESILSRLSERFRLLRGQRRDQSDRQATLRGAIDWSWTLLSPVEQAAMAQLSVFRGGCQLDSAEAVLRLDEFDEDAWVMDVVESLVDQSLLRRVEPHAGHVRYRMLESIRQYAAEKLGEETDRIARHHAEHFSSLGAWEQLRALNTHGGVERRADLTPELENLRAGFDTSLDTGEAEVAALCAIAASELYLMNGPFSDGISLLDRLAEVELGNSLRTRLAHKAGLLMYRTGKSADAQVQLDRALALAHQAADRQAGAVLLADLGLIHRNRGRNAEAMEHYRQAISATHDSQDRQTAAITLARIGLLLRDRGQTTDAMEHFHQSIEMSREVGDRYCEGCSLADLASIHHQKGQTEEAIAQLQQALTIHREVGNRRGEGHTLANLGYLYSDQDRIPEALEHYQMSLSIVREIGDRQSEGTSLGNLGEMLFFEEDLDAAEPHLIRAITITDETFPLASGAFRGILALVRAQQGAIEEGRSLLAEGEPKVRGVRKHELGKFLCNKARVEHLAGDLEASNDAMMEAETIARELDSGAESGLGQAIIAARAQLSPR